MSRPWVGTPALGFGLALVVLAACETPTLPLDRDLSPDDSELPYDFRLTVAPAGQAGTAVTRTFHWPLGATVAVLVVEEVEGRPSLSQALSQGIVRWERAALFGEFRITETSDPARADAVITWDDSEPIHSAPPGCTGPTTGAAALRGCLTEAGDSLRVWQRRDGGPSRMIFRVTINRSTEMSEDFLDTLVTHELGHVVGILSHSTLSSDVMWGGPIDSPELSERDRLTVRSLYQTESDLPVARR